MPSDPPGGPADGGQLTDYELSPEELKQLAAEMARMFPTEALTSDFLQRIVRIPRGAVSSFKHGPEPAEYETPEAYWRRIIPELQRGNIIELPLRRLVRSVREYKATTSWFDMKFPRERGVPEADLATGARSEGCHAIILTDTVDQRLKVSKWLTEEGLAPRTVWINHEMTSFGVSERDPRRLASLIRSEYQERLIKVIPPGERDGLIRWLNVQDVGNVELEVPDMPIQLTVAQLGEAAARFHPSARSRRIRPPADGSRAEFAEHVGGGAEQQVPIDSTLLDFGIRDGHRVAIKSVKFETIRVVFVCANPEWNDAVQPTRARAVFGRELSKIRESTRHRHIELVDIQDATRDHLGAIFEAKPDIIHLACHAEGGQFFWDDGWGGQDPLPAEWLAGEFAKRAKGRARGQVSGIVISACYGEQTGEPFMRAARDVIAHPGLLSDSTAERFTAKFYDEIFQMPVLRSAAEFAAARIRHDVLIFSPDMQGGS